MQVVYVENSFYPWQISGPLVELTSLEFYEISAWIRSSFGNNAIATIDGIMNPNYSLLFVRKADAILTKVKFA